MLSKGFDTLSFFPDSVFRMRCRQFLLVIVNQYWSEPKFQREFNILKVVF